MPRIIRKTATPPAALVADETPETETATPAPESPRTVAAIEADARAGVPVSLSELADAINREKPARKSARAARAPAAADVVAPELTETAETPAPVAESAAAPVALLVPAADLVIADESGPDADLYEAPRATAEEDAALRESIAAEGIAQPVQVVRRSNPSRLVVLNGRRRVTAARALDALALVPVVVRPDVSGIRAELAAAELNETGVASNPAVLVDRLARARAAGVEEGALIRAAGRASRARSLLVFADRAGPDLRMWLEEGTLSESTACLMAEATPDATIQAAALVLLQAEVDAARASPDGKAAGLTGSRKGDATIDDEGRAHVTRAAASVAVSRALAEAGAVTRRTAAPVAVAPELPAADETPAAADETAADESADETDRPAPIVVPAWAKTPPPAAPAPAPAPAPVAGSNDAAQASRPAPRTKPGALAGSVTAAAAAALSRAYGVAPSTLTGDGRAFLSGLRAALDFLSTGARPTGDIDRRFGATFSAVFPE